jgi:hypothetical protein
MILRRVAFKPLCRQCGHKFERPVARCPMCGLRTGYVEPLRAPPRQGIENRGANAEIVAETDLDEEADDMVLAPPVERPPTEPLSLENHFEREQAAAAPSVPAPVARRVSLGSLMIGTMLVAACLGLGRVLLAAGVITFLVLVPAYVRTLSAISYYRDHRRELGREDIAAIFATSLVLALMGLAVGGLVFLVTMLLTGLVVRFFPWDEPVPIGTILGTAAAFVTVFVLVHKVWPVNED